MLHRLLVVLLAALGLGCARHGPACHLLLRPLGCDAGRCLAKLEVSPPDCDPGVSAVIEPDVLPVP